MACKYLHIVNSIVANTTATTLTLDFVNTASAVDKNKFCFKIPCSMQIPSGTEAYTVLVTVNGSEIPLWDKYGNPATVSELRKGKIISGYYGATTPHVVSKIPMTFNCGCNNVL